MGSYWKHLNFLINMSILTRGDYYENFDIMETEKFYSMINCMYT